MWTESTEGLFNNINIRGSSKSTSVIVLGSAHVQLFIDIFVSKAKNYSGCEETKRCRNMYKSQTFSLGRPHGWK